MNKQELTEKQEAFVEAIYNCGGKADAMKYIAMLGEDLPKVNLPGDCIIAGCLSRTYFRAQIDSKGLVQIDGSSQSIIMSGVIQIMRDCFNGYTPAEVRTAGVTWVRDSGILGMLTPQRQGAIHQMIERINRTCEA